MFCPKCAQQMSDGESRYCSKCGFLTANIPTLIKDGGELGPEPRAGFRQGAKLVLLSLIFLPILILLAPMFPPNDTLIESSPSNTWFEQIGWTIFWTIFLAGVARIFFALVFEGKSSAANLTARGVESLNGVKQNQALPPSQESPASSFGKWKITDELCEPIVAQKKTSGNIR
jgi:hypothetical protein